MDKAIIVGRDLHDATLLIKIGVNRNDPMQRTYENNSSGRLAMCRFVEKLAKAEGGAKIYFAYEAGSQGFGLYDELDARGWQVSVLAPTRIERSPKQRKQKMDPRDAERLLEILRGHVLAGNKLPTVWVPDPQTRDDRELVRARLDVAKKARVLKVQMGSLLKRASVRKPEEAGNNWTRKHKAWLRGLTQAGSPLSTGARYTLASLLRQLEALQDELASLDKSIAQLAQEPRYAAQVAALTSELGVAVLSAMVFLTEMGDLSRFQNRRQVGAYLGLTPACFESGEASKERKGHITHQGPARVRMILCQCVWARLGCDAATIKAHARISDGKKQRRKIATVALMRQLGIRLWRLGLAAQRQAAGAETAPASDSPEQSAPTPRRFRMTNRTRRG